MKKFTKEDLRTGMIIKIKAGNKFLVLKGCFDTLFNEDQTIMFINQSTHLSGDNYDFFLKNREGLDTFDIVKIYTPTTSNLQSMFKNCNESNLIWERKTNWSKVPIDTKILVTDNLNGVWLKRYFAKYENGEVHTFLNGATSWSDLKGTCAWNFAQLAEEDNKNDG